MHSRVRQSRAYRVPAVSPADVADVFFVRATLEGVGAMLAIDHLTPAHLGRFLMLLPPRQPVWVTFLMRQQIDQRKQFRLGKAVSP